MIKGYQPLHHKYRPQRFDELVGQEAISATLTQALLMSRIAPAYLFCGPRGTGKTSSARILARSLNCINEDHPTPKPCGKCELCEAISQGSCLDVIEIDAASNTGVENIRELIERARFSPVQARWKVYVIDECHMLSTAAFNALLKTLEEPPNQVVFVLATTDPQRVLPTILSRCQRFDFKRIRNELLVKHLQMIADSESIRIDSKALHLVAQKAQGGLRDAESMLDQLSLITGEINVELVWQLLGVVPEEELLLLLNALANKDASALLDSCRKIIDQGKEPISVLQGFVALLRDLVLIKAAPGKPELLSISANIYDELANHYQNLELSEILDWQRNLRNTEYQLRNSMQPSLWIEVILLGLLSNGKTIETAEKIKVASLPKEIKDQGYLSSNSQSSKGNTANQAEVSEIDKESIDQLNNSNKTSQDLSELWKQILGSLELPSTRMLLSQQAKLAVVNNQSVVVHVADNWIGMVQSRSILLEQAIAKVLGASRKVIIESQRNDEIIFDSIKPGQQNNQDNQQYINDDSEIKKPDYESPKKSYDLNQKQEVGTEEEISLDNRIQGDAQNLADFFNGEVLDLD